MRLIRKAENGEGEGHKILVVLLIVVAFLLFPNTMYGFLGWFGDSVYKAVGAKGPSPFHKGGQPATTDTSKLNRQPLKDPNTGKKAELDESGVDGQKKNPPKKKSTNTKDNRSNAP